MLRIGQFSKLARVSIKALRYYDRIGLLKPAMIDTSTSYRYYTEDQLARVNLISAYKAAGLSNESILSLLDHAADKGTLLREQYQLLCARRDELAAEISRLERLMENANGQEYTATLAGVPGQRVYCCRGYVSDATCIHDFIKACVREFERSNPDVELTERDYCCVIYPDDGYRESNIFIEYAQSVKRFGTDTAVLKFKEIEPITAVSVLHRGGYDTLRDAYLFAVNWMRERGYELGGEPRERYINGAWNCEEESEWLTELQLPIREVRT